MEPVHVRNKASKFASQDDVINTMPQNVITNILDRLPIEVAVRTSILSRNWRFKWTLLTRLVFDYEFFYNGKDITRVLLHLKGPITKFVLLTPKNVELDVEDISHWVFFLSGKGIKEFTLINNHETPLKLPTHLFFCLELEHLTLRNCYIHSPSTFSGFPNLLSLDFNRVSHNGNCVEFLSKCQLLEILKIKDSTAIGKLTLSEIVGLKNLKMLYLPLCVRLNIAITSSPILQLGSYFPKLQELTLDFLIFQYLGEAGVCAAFPYLKTLTLYQIEFASASMLSFAFQMIWASPNIKTLTIRAKYIGNVPPPAFYFPEEDTKLQQLQSVMFECFRGSENEVYLIKSLLACSPFLKTMRIGLNSSSMVGGADGKFMFATKLLELDRASPTAKVKLFQF